MARTHRLFLPDLDAQRDDLVVTGDEAEHARRVRRAAEGDRVILLNGAGLVAECVVASAKRELALRVVERRTIEPERPMVEVFAATPKGSRADEMIDALSQAGAHSWTPLETKLSVVEPRKNKMERMTRIAAESAKQSVRPWIMRIDEMVSFDDALASSGGARIVIADQSGEPYTPLPGGSERVRMFIGPEGGWTDGELARARDAGAMVASFGRHTMRIEVAAPVACAIVIDQERRAAPGV